MYESRPATGYLALTFKSFKFGSLSANKWKKLYVPAIDSIDCSRGKEGERAKVTTALAILHSCWIIGNFILWHNIIYIITFHYLNTYEPNCFQPILQCSSILFLNTIKLQNIAFDCSGFKQKSFLDSLVDNSKGLCVNIGDHALRNTTLNMV